MTVEELFKNYEELDDSEKTKFLELIDPSLEISKLNNLSYRVSIADQIMSLNNSFNDATDGDIIGTTISIDWIMKNILKLEDFGDRVIKLEDYE